MAGGGGGPTFEGTPSWVIGGVVFVIIAVSLAIEKLLHYLGKVIKSSFLHLIDLSIISTSIPFRFIYIYIFNKLQYYMLVDVVKEGEDTTVSCLKQG